MVSPTDDRVVAPSAPRRVFFESIAQRRIEAIRSVAASLSQDDLVFQPAYSCKTNPNPTLLRQALDAGIFAEVISQGELETASRSGFTGERVVYNGPVPLLASPCTPAFAFADSVESFSDYVASTVARVPGVRLRPSMVRSRFGVTCEEDDAIARALITHSGSRDFGASFHVRPEDYGRAGWRDIASDVMDRAGTLARQARRRFVAFDIGGGWTPERFDAEFADDAGWLATRLRALAPDCSTVLFEPGQAIATPTEALLATVVAVRRRGMRREVILNAGYPDWPQMHGYVHRIYARSAGRWRVLPAGADAIGGRTCLEYDRIEGIALPDPIEPGMELLIGDCGSYDGSMSFRFGMGSR